MRRLRHVLTLSSLLLAPVLGLGTIARADDGDLESAREYARGELIKEARGAGARSRAGDAAIDAMRRGLVADIEFAASYQPVDEKDVARLAALRETIDERLLLLGRPATGEGADADPGTEGALQQADRLTGWLTGRESCATLVRTRGAADDEVRTYVYPPPSPPEPDPAERPAQKEDPGEPSPQGEDPGAAAEPEGPPEAEVGKTAEKPPPPKTEKAEGAKKPETEPAGPPDVHVWARKIVRVAESGRLIDREFETVPCADVDALTRAAQSKPVYIHPDAGRIRRSALVAKQVFAYSAPLAALRLLQADERNKAMQADLPQPSLVDGAMVREKTADVERYTELIERHAGREARLLTRLDAMVEDLDAWKTQAALMASEIEERRRALGGPGKEAPEAEVEDGDLVLRVAQARETLATIEITLLYLTAVRAWERIQLLHLLDHAAREEATAAEHVQTRYVRALVRLRSTRRLDRIQSNNRSLQRWLAAAEDEKAPAGTRKAQRLDAYRTMLALNEISMDAVRRRKLMSPGGAEAKAPSKDEQSGTASEEDPEAAAAEGPQLSAVIAAPGKASWDLKYVQIARRELEDPKLRHHFDAVLVADHYAAVDERIRALLEAFQVSRDEEGLRADFERTVVEVEKALEPLRHDVLTVRVHRLPNLLVTAKEDFQAAMEGIVAQRKRNQDRLEALVDYRRTLRDQGTRSLLIRVNRELEDPNLVEALQDTQRVFDSAGQWASFQGESHAGGFLREQWLRMALVTLALIVIMLAARFGRRIVDAWIEKRVAAYPEVAAGSASVRVERERAKEQRRAAVDAAAETSEDAVLQQGAERQDSLQPPVGERSEGSR